MTNKLLSHLFGGVHEGYLNIWAKSSGSFEKPSKWFDLSKDGELDRAEAEALALDARGFDAYFGVGLTSAPILERTDPKTGKVTKNPRISANDVACLPAYYVDVDTLLDPKKDGKNVPKDPAEALALLSKLPYPPSACVLSGQGVHSYWLLDSPIQLNDDNREAVASALRAFAEAVAAAVEYKDLDTKASEPARVLRVPGTCNHKQAEALPVKLAEGCSWTRYSLSELDAWARQQADESPSAWSEKPSEAAREAEEASTEAGSPDASAPLSVDDDPGGEPFSMDMGPHGPNVSPGDYLPGGKYYLTDEQVWKVLEKRDDRLIRLKNGDISGYSSQSDAEIAACDGFAFATGRNPARMDQLYRNTLLYRDKWDEVHYANGETYGEHTIAEACRSTKEVYRGRDFYLDRLAEDRRRAFEAVRAAYEKSSGGGYLAEPGSPFRTCAQKISPNGDASIEPLTDFVAVPLEDVQRDDGAEVRRELVMEGYNYRGDPLPRISVPARDLASFRWVDERWPGAVIEPGNAKKDKLRAAIQKVARLTATPRSVYSHSGWREIDGRWVFLYNGGAVGAEDVSVELPGTLAGYTLPESRPGESTRELARASLGLLDIAPRRVTVPLLATMYLAPLREWFAQAGEPICHILILHGKTQAKKSVLSALFLSHFGPGWNYQSLPFNFQSTSNAIREGIFLAKDLPAIVDDFHPSPTGARYSVNNMNQTAQDLARAWGDHAARQRMNADQTLRTAKPARGLGVWTAEYLPDLSESGNSRYYVTQMNPGDVDVGKLSEAQDAARAGVYGRAMRGFLGWLCWRVNNEGAEAFADELGHAFREKRMELLRAAGDYGGHGRLSTACAHLLTGFDVVLEYFAAIGAVDEAQRAELAAEALRVFMDAQRVHAEDVRASDPLRMFATSVVELRNEYGRFVRTSDGALWSGDEKLCGWIGDDRTLHALPKKLFRAVSELCMGAGSPFPISPRELWKRLYEAGVSSTERGVSQHVPGQAKSQYTIRISLDRLEALLDGPAEAAQLMSPHTTIKDGALEWDAVIGG